ncbi:MAG: DEAD/DEAH box helicase family protein [Thermoplasmataceae archaeon]
MEISFDRGTVVITGMHESENVPDFVKYDARINAFRAPACFYRNITEMWNFSQDTVFDGEYKQELTVELDLRSYQKEAISRWMSNGKSGIIVLPTATGKTHIGLEAISLIGESTLVIAPTIELVQQWRDRLEKTFGIEIGQIGGSIKELRNITVSTYDSAYLLAEKLGNRFRFILADEVHHMASEQYSQIAKMYAAPYRMGLTATYERPDGLEESLSPYMGGKVFELGYEELSDHMAGFEVVRVPVELSFEEEDEYNRNRDIFLSYIKRYHITLRGPFDFQKFIRRSWNREGREALLAWRRSREVAFSARAKTDFVRYVLTKHRDEKILIFSEDTETAYMISKTFLIPALTYKTPGPERKKYLEFFRSGTVKKIATSRILDEGVDVPDASVAVVISGSGSNRQFKQRLGRIVRPGEGKTAIMYELVSSGTGEYNTSRRRGKGVPKRTSFSKA